MKPEPTGRAGITVLVVEDDRIVLELLEKILIGRGFSVMVAENGAEALAAFQHAQPELILLDWLLPDTDGLTLARQFRAAKQGKYLTILMLSGKDGAEDNATAIEAGVDYFAAKPLNKSIIEIWLSVAEKHVRDSRQRRDDELALIQVGQELEANNSQLEQAIARANEMAREAERAYIEINQIFKTVAGGILLVDRSGKVLRCNDSFLLMAGISRENALAGRCHEVFPTSLCGTTDCPLQRVRRGNKRIEVDIERQDAEGRSTFYHMISSPFMGPGGDLVGVVKHITDITERVKSERALVESERRYRSLSFVDELTGLYNKRYFNKHFLLEIERSARHGQPLALMLMDIDNFKHHNDTYGHSDGDRVLARLGVVITESMRIGDIPCRYGGEEFVVILPATAGEGAMVVAERIRSRFAEEVFEPKPNEKVQKTLSIGIARLGEGEGPGSLLERADQNMYEAKQGGKNRSILR